MYEILTQNNKKVNLFAFSLIKTHYLNGYLANTSYLLHCLFGSFSCSIFSFGEVGWQIDRKNINFGKSI